jgi:hypothetical protein
MRQRFGDDRGSTIPLVVGLAALALCIVLAVTAATSLYVERKRLFTLADGAALAGAEAYELDDISADGEGVRARLSDPAVSAAVADYVAAAPHPSLDHVRVEQAESPDGESATVTLSAMWRPPVVTLFVPEGIRLEVTSTSRSVFR